MSEIFALHANHFQWPVSNHNKSLLALIVSMIYLSHEVNFQAKVLLQLLSSHATYSVFNSKFYIFELF